MPKAAPDHEVKDPEDRANRKALRVRRPKIDPEPWERQIQEPEKAYAAFEIYRDAHEERNLRATAREAGLSQRTIEYYASRYAWVERVLAYDNYITRAAIIQRRKDVESMQKRHANTALLMQNKIVQRLNAVDPDELSIDQLGKWFDLAVKVERQAREIEEQPAVQVNIGAPQSGDAIVGSTANPLAIYLEKHPDRIPFIMPLLERFSRGDRGALDEIEQLVHNGRGSEAASELEGVLAPGDEAVRSIDLGDGDSTGVPAEGRGPGLHDTPVPG